MVHLDKWLAQFTDTVRSKLLQHVNFIKAGIFYNFYSYIFNTEVDVAHGTYYIFVEGL